MTKKQREKLAGATGMGKLVHFKLKGGIERREMGLIVDEVYVIVGEYKHLIQRIQIRSEASYWDGSRFAYRTCYYTYDAQRKHVKFGQYTAFLTEKEYEKLLSKAKKKGWRIF